MKELIADEIARSGPIPFERFMELALYDPGGGYFTTGPLRSHERGDFLTSPEVSEEFGATLARYVEREFRRIGKPPDFTVVEVGAGSGSLLEPLLEVLPFTPRVIAVEASRAARESIRARLPKVEVVPRGELLARFRGVVIANELVDNLPMALAMRSSDGWTELRVGVDGAQLVLVEAPVRPGVLAWLDSHARATPEGGVVECQLEAASWLDSMIGLLVAGSVVVSDYGDTSQGLEPRRRSGTLRTYRSHHLGPYPLDEPGTTDLTADVDFSALLDVVETRRMDAGLFRQHEFLDDLGLGDRLKRLRREELERARTGEVMDRLRIRSKVKEIETLLHPRGLGDFLVLVARR